MAHGLNPTKWSLVALLTLGAAACRLVSPPAPMTRPVHADEAPMAARLRSHVERLATTIGERNRLNRAGLDQARDYIRAQFEEMGYPTSLLAFEHDGETFHNVEAVFRPGAARWIVIGAHYDTVPGSPGADDNASGVAALIEIARELQSLEGAAASPYEIERGIRFVAFANEEPPYFNSRKGMGSIEYVRQMPMSADQVDAMISMDSIGFFRDEPDSQTYPPGTDALFPNRGDFLAFVGDVPSRALVHDTKVAFGFKTTFPSESAVLPASTRGVYFSDHRSFAEVGIPAVMATDTALFRNPNYHLGSDTADDLDYDRMAQVADGMVYVTRMLLSSDKSWRRVAAATQENPALAFPPHDSETER